MTGSSKRKPTGQPIKTFHDQGVRSWDYCLWVIPGILLPIGFIAYGSYLAVLGSTRELALQGQQWLLTAALLLIPYAMLSTRAYFRSRRTVTIHENGFRLTHITAKSRFIFWDQVQSIRTFGTRYHLFGRPLSDRYQLSIQTRSGEILAISGLFNDFDELVMMLQNKVKIHLGDSISKNMDAGKLISFGPISVGQAGMRVRQSTIEWGDLEEVGVHGGMLMIKSKAHIYKVSVREIPNAEQLLQILSIQSQNETHARKMAK